MRADDGEEELGAQGHREPVRSSSPSRMPGRVRPVRRVERPRSRAAYAARSTPVDRPRSAAAWSRCASLHVTGWRGPCASRRRGTRQRLPSRGTRPTGCRPGVNSADDRHRNVARVLDDVHLPRSKAKGRACAELLDRLSGGGDPGPPERRRSRRRGGSATAPGRRVATKRVAAASTRCEGRQDLDARLHRP